MFCEICFEKQQRIDKLETENELLRARLYQQERSAREKPFASSTPSSKINIKPKSSEENQNRQGGAKAGHVGHGRSCCDGTPDEIIDIPAPEVCPDCGQALTGHGLVNRTVKDLPRLEIKTVRYQIKRGFCPHCQKTIVSKNLPVLPNSLLGNQLITHVAEQHYLQDVPIGSLSEQLSIGKGTLIGSFHRLRELFSPGSFGK